MCCKTSHRGEEIFSYRMKLGLVLFTCVMKWCSGIRLSPLENNDKLQDITNLYVAEWQWESWPVKQDLSEQEGRSPSQRKNVALWKDSSGSAWYLFGGQPVNSDLKKMYSDVWKFTVKTRAWKRLFPSQAELKGAYRNKTGRMMSLPVNLFDGKNGFDMESSLQSTVLCGGLGKENEVKVKKLKTWSSFRRKADEEKTEDRITSLAIYAPKTSNYNTVWQIDRKSKLWTAYVCCCDTRKSKIGNTISDSSKSLVDIRKISNSNQTEERVADNEKSSKPVMNECPIFDLKINKAEDEVDNEQQHLKISNLKNKKKKINQMKNSTDKSNYKKLKIEKRGRSKVNEKPEGVELPFTEENSTGGENKTVQAKSNMKINITNKKEKSILKVRSTNQEKNQTGASGKMKQLKVASMYCPEYSQSGTSVTWCDGKNEAIISLDIGSPKITLWVFNLSTSHWSQMQVKASAQVEWSTCSNMSSVRYAGNGENVFIICSQVKTISNDSHRSPENSTDLSKIPSKENFNKKLVFRLNYKDQELYCLGTLLLNPYFNSPEGEKVWRNESQTILHVIGNSKNETILVLAYLNMVDLWVLSNDNEGKKSFHLVEKIWRGSALKWFDKYNAALYSLQFLSESGDSETILLPNPRNIGSNEYWPRERGRFIIRVFRNENLKNQSFENKTREQNLTYELLQSDYKPRGSENQLNHMYSLKVLVFFGISLTIFSVVGIVLFLKRCVTCPPRIRVRNECHKSPLVIRYSVIPDDMMYPVA